MITTLHYGIMKDRKVYAVDLDGTLCEKISGGWWAKENAPDPKPIPKVIKKVNEWYTQGHTIIIHTARPRMYYEATEAWLIKHGVYYHAIRMGKVRADFYIDDKAINVKDL